MLTFQTETAVPLIRANQNKSLPAFLKLNHRLFGGRRGFFFGFPTVWLSPRPPHSVRAGSIHCVSQQGWSLSSNKPLSHRLMPGDDKSPPRIGSDQLSAWLNPKGETERVPQCDVERQTGKGKNSSFYLSSSQAAISLQDMTARLDFLPSCLIFLLSFNPLSFSPSDEKIFL